MATKRQRSSGAWEYVVKRKRLLGAPLYLSFKTESEGDQYVARLEALLDKGIVPDEFKEGRDAPKDCGKGEMLELGQRAGLPDWLYGTDALPWATEFRRTKTA